jgi:hypothetical protein
MPLEKVILVYGITVRIAGGSVVAVSKKSSAVYIATWEFEQDPAQVAELAAKSDPESTRMPEFAGAVWLRRSAEFSVAKREDPQNGSGSEPTERVVEWIQWSRLCAQSQCELSVIKQIRTPGSRRHGHGELYSLKGVITGSGSDELEVTTGMRGVTFVMLGALERAQWACEFVMNEARENIRHLPGFIGAAFLLGSSSSRMAEIIRWESLDAFQAATNGNTRFREKIQEAGKYVDVDGASYVPLSERKTTPRGD